MKNESIFIKISSEPINHVVLVLLGYSHSPALNYYCPPSPAHGGLYRIELRATVFTGGNPVKGTEKWSAFLPYDNECTIRTLDTIGELNYFHKGMCGEWLL